MGAETYLRLGRFAIDLAARSVTDGVGERRMSPRAAKALALLLQAGGEVVTRTELLDHVWPGLFVTDESVTQVIAELRRALDDRAGGPRMIETVAKSGYRLRMLPEQRNPAEMATDQFDPFAYALLLDAESAIMEGGRDAIARALALAEEAVGVAPEMPMALAQLGIFEVLNGHYGGGSDANHRRALGFSERAIRHAPEQASGYSAKSMALAALGDRSGSRAAMARALFCGRDDGLVHYRAARVLFAQGEFRAAFSLADRAVALLPGESYPSYLAARSALAFDPDLARRKARLCLRSTDTRLGDNPDEPRARSSRALALCLLGDVTAAAAALKASNGSGTLCAIHDTFATIAMGDVDAGMESLEEAMDQGFRETEWLSREPILQPVRHERRFRKLVAAA